MVSQTVTMETSNGDSSPGASSAAHAEQLVENNRRFAEQFPDAELGVSPTRHLAIVACMDSRMDIFRLLGLGNGEAHVIRNAGGVVTDDVIRSLCLSQRSMGTSEIILLHHTDCGLQSVSEDSFRAEVEAEVGMKPWWALEAFADPFDDVRQSINRLHLTPFVLYKDRIRGFVYDVGNGILHSVAHDKPGE